MSIRLCVSLSSDMLLIRDKTLKNEASGELEKLTWPPSFFDPES